METSWSSVQSVEVGAGSGPMSWWMVVKMAQNKEMWRSKLEEIINWKQRKMVDLT